VAAKLDPTHLFKNSLQSFEPRRKPFDLQGSQNVSHLTAAVQKNAALVGISLAGQQTLENLT
jgi:hypothetical protein